MEKSKSLARTSQMLTQGYGVDLIKRVASLTVASAQKGEQLSKLSREDENATVAMISTILNNLNNSINIGEKMSAEQIIETTYAIISEHWALKIDEVLNCFKMAKSGKFGKLYGLDQPTVMSFLLKYDTEVKAGHYQQNETTHTNRQREEKDGPKHIALSIDEINQLKKQ